MNSLIINNNLRVFEENVGTLYRCVSLCCKGMRYRGEKSKLHSTDATRCQFSALTSNARAERCLPYSIPKTSSKWGKEENE